MSKKKLPIFWGYLDTDGKVHVKNYTNDQQIANYERMFFVVGIFDPFTAIDATDARRKIIARYVQELH